MLLIFVYLFPDLHKIPPRPLLLAKLQCFNIVEAILDLVLHVIVLFLKSKVFKLEFKINLTKLNMPPLHFMLMYHILSIFHELLFKLPLPVCLIINNFVFDRSFQGGAKVLYLRS